MEIKAVDGSNVTVLGRVRFRLGDAIFKVKRVRPHETVAARAGGTTPVVICTFEGGIPPQPMKNLEVGQEFPLPGDMVATLVKQAK